jgi:hypothetical protein
MFSQYVELQVWRGGVRFQEDVQRQLTAQDGMLRRLVARRTVKNPV